MKKKKVISFIMVVFGIVGFLFIMFPGIYNLFCERFTKIQVINKFYYMYIIGFLCFVPSQVYYYFNKEN